MDDERESPVLFTGTEKQVCDKEHYPVVNILQSNEQSSHFKHIMSVLNYLKDKYGKDFFYTYGGNDTDYYYDGMKMQVYAVDDTNRKEYTAACKLLPGESVTECSDDYTK